MNDLDSRYNLCAPRFPLLFVGFPKYGGLPVHVPLFIPPDLVICKKNIQPKKIPKYGGFPKKIVVSTVDRPTTCDDVFRSQTRKSDMNS